MSKVCSKFPFQANSLQGVSESPVVVCISQMADPLEIYSFVADSVTKRLNTIFRRQSMQANKY
jgi:hypothetical protein